MKKIFLSLVASIISLAASAETWTIQGSSYTVDVTSTQSLGAGTTLTKARVYNSSRSMTIFYTVTDLTNQDVEIRTVAGGSKLSSRATVPTMAGTITDATPIAGINGGFFSSSTPGGMTVINGNARKGFSGDGYYSIALDGDNVPYVGYLNQITCWCSAVNGVEGWSNYAAINSTPSYVSGCGVGEMLIFYTPEYGSTSSTSGTGGYAVQLTPVDGATLTPGEYVKYKVASTPSTGNVTIPSSGIVLYGKGDQNGTYVSGLSVGQEITVYLKSYLKDNNGVIESPVMQQALGGSAMILCDGVTMSSYPNTLGDISYSAPRTAVGYNSDKTKLVMLVVDGRNSGWADGCNGKMLGDMMRILGCSDAMNFDGGGSSTFWTCNEGVVNDTYNNNSQSGTIRSVADGLFIVKLPTPVLSASSNSLSFTTTNSASVSKSVTISGSDLRGNIKLALSGTNADCFSLSSTSIAESTASATITVTYAPTSTGSHSAAVTVTTDAATSLTINLSGSNTEETTTPEPVLPGTTTVESGLTKLWQNTASVPGNPAGGDFRFAGVSNDHLLVVDKTNLKIYELTETGYTEYYNCADALSTHWSATSMGPAIACDDAGNILVHTGWSGAASGSNFMIISADLSKTYKLDLSAVDGYTAARIDQVGRIRGNMLSSEGGYLFLTPSAASEALIVKIVNGEIDSNYTQLSNATGVAFDTSTIAQPAFETVAEIDALMDDNADLSNSFVVRKRGNPANVFTWNADNTALEATYEFTNTTSEGYTTTNASSEGFDWFKLEGKSYFIMPLSTDGTTGGRSSAWAIFDQGGNIAAYAAENLKTGIGQGFGSFIAVPNDNKSVLIYHFIAGTVAEKYIYAIDTTTSVEDILIEENADAPVEYYNLQGIKVENPENGIYIKVQGNNVSKVYVK